MNVSNVSSIKPTLLLTFIYSIYQIKASGSLADYQKKSYLGLYQKVCLGLDTMQ